MGIMCMRIDCGGCLASSWLDTTLNQLVGNHKLGIIGMCMYLLRVEKDKLSSLRVNWDIRDEIMPKCLSFRNAFFTCDSRDSVLLARVPASLVHRHAVGLHMERCSWMRALPAELKMAYIYSQTSLFQHLRNLFILHSSPFFRFKLKY